MKRLAILLLSVLFLCLPGAGWGRSVLILTVDGAIGPATADYLHRGLEKAAKQQAELVVLQIDTPGGLDTSMREIIQDILASPIPVAVFVAPTGARAASAGTYILYAAHVAAMAPATNLGAATPVAIGLPGPGTPDKQPKPSDKGGEDKKDGEKTPARTEPQDADAMARKQMHDAAAYIRSLAQLRGRNVEWAEKAVREAVSLSAEEALREKVIDLTARDVPDLLAKLNGRQVSVLGAMRTLNTAGVVTEAFEPDWRNRLLSVITNPSVALILMMIGVYGLFFEFANPGFVLPGVAGAICLLLALFAFQLLPINYAGLALILLGIAFMVAEAFLPSFGVLGIGGVAAFVFGAILLIDPEQVGFGIPLALIVPMALVSAAFVMLVGSLALKARRRPVVSGREELVGSFGEVVEQAGGQSWARVHGELWRVESAEPLRPGQPVKVTGVDGLTLQVTPGQPETKGE